MNKKTTKSFAGDSKRTNLVHVAAPQTKIGLFFVQESLEDTLMLLLFASTKFCDFGSGMILRVLIFAISWSRAKFWDFAQPKVKINFEIHWL